MNSRVFTRAGAAATLALAVASPAHAQLGALRRAAQAAARGGNPAAAAASQPQQRTAAQSLGGDVLEMTPAVLDRFQQGLAAEAADRQQTARQLAALKTPEQYGQCTMQYLMSPSGQALTGRISAAAGKQDQAAMIALGDSLKAHYRQACGVDPSTRHQMEQDARGHSSQAGEQAGQFTGRQYPILKERVVPFCRAQASAAASGDVRLQGSGSGVFWVYTGAEAAALHDRCAALMQALDANT